MSKRPFYRILIICDLVILNFLKIYNLLVIDVINLRLEKYGDHFKYNLTKK